MTPIHVAIVVFGLSIAGGAVGWADAMQSSANDREASQAPAAAKRMLDGKEWTTSNLNVSVPSSFCYDDAVTNCVRYGRLYTWEAAQRVCQSLGEAWRLPSDDEWRQMAKHDGGIGDDSADKGKAALTSLLIGGTSGFNAVLSGNRTAGQYARLEAHGF